MWTKLPLEFVQNIYFFFDWFFLYIYFFIHLVSKIQNKPKKSKFCYLLPTIRHMREKNAICNWLTFIKSKQLKTKKTSKDLLKKDNTSLSVVLSQPALGSKFINN